MANKHVLFIAQNRGGLVKRAFHYLKPEREKMFSVRVKNLLTQSSFDYDQYHDEIEDGKYVLIFSCPEHDHDHHYEFEVTSSSGPAIYIVYSWNEFMYLWDCKKVSKEEFEQMAAEKRLMNPLRYNGY